MATTLELIHVIGLVIVDTTNQVIAVLATTRTRVVLGSISLAIVVTRVHQLLGTDITQQRIAVIGLVTVDIINQGIPVSAIILPLVVQDNISLVIAVIHVALFHQMATTLELIHVIGAVIQDTINRVTRVSVITITTPVV
jgi:hypothetical protein